MKYPVLYKRGTKNFDNNGKGVLADAFDVKVKEVINDIFTLDFKYPMSSKLSHDIANGDLIKVDASKVLKNQKFRIVSITQNDDLTISVHALHKSFDTVTDYVKGPLNIEHGSCEYALNMLFNKSMKSKNYVGVSNIQNAQKFACIGKQLGAAIIGSEGSLIDTYGLGAQIERDNSEVDKISILTRRGKDTNILIAYGKNITGYKCVMDEQSLATILVPYATDRDTQDKIIGPYVYAPNFEDFDGELYVLEVDVTDRFAEGEKINEDALALKGRQYMEESSCNIPKFTYTVDFEKLDTSSFPPGYNLDKLYEVNIGDTLIIRHNVFKVDTQGKVSSIEYDPISDKYTKIVIGDVRASFGVIEGPQGKPGENGQDGVDGKTYYTWIKYADTPTSGMSDNPAGKAYMGIAYNKETREESNRYEDYEWSKIKGEDGDLGDFPNTIPEVPSLEAEVVGLSGIDLSWTFENKMYYTYELYASQVKDFSPTVFDKIFEGKASSYLHQVNPNENWYFRVRGVNSYGRASEFSQQVHVMTNKQDNFEQYFSSLAVTQLVADIFSVNHMHAGIIKGNWIDAKNLTVTDGNGHRTLDIDSFGRVTILPTDFKVLVNDQEESVVTVSEFNTNNESINMKFTQTGGTNEIKNSKCINSTDFWSIGGHSGSPTVKLNTGQGSIQFEVHGYGSAGGIQTDSIPVIENSIHTLGFEYNIIRGMESYCELHYYSYDAKGFNVTPDVGKVVVTGKELSSNGEINYTFTVPTGAKYMQVYFYTAYNGTESNKYDYAYFTIYNLRCFYSPVGGRWQPAPNEAYAGNIKFNEKGIEQVYNNEFKSRWGADALEFLTPNNVRKLAIDRSQFCTYNFDDGNFLSFIGATKHATYSKIFGNSINTSRHCAFFDVSHNPNIIDDSAPLDFTNSYFRVNFFEYDDQVAGTHVSKYPLYVHNNLHVDNNVNITQDCHVWGDIRAENYINAKYIICIAGIDMKNSSLSNVYATKYGPGTSCIVKGDGKQLQLGGLSAGDSGGTVIGCATPAGDIQRAIWISSPSFVWNYADWNFGSHNIYEVNIHSVLDIPQTRSKSDSLLINEPFAEFDSDANKVSINLGEAVKSVYYENKQLNDELNTSLLANADMYEMIIALTPTTMKTPSNNAIIDVYVSLINRGLKVVSDVPEVIKSQVETELNK